MAKATEDEKSELLKEVLGFVNCWRRADAFILIGVEDIKRRKSVLEVAAMRDLKLRPAFTRTGHVDIDKNDHETKVEIECGNLQPGRRVWSDVFCIGIAPSTRGPYRRVGESSTATTTRSPGPGANSWPVGGGTDIMTHANSIDVTFCAEPVLWG